MPRRSKKLTKEGILKATKSFAKLALTQSQISSELGISRSSISNFLNGKPVTIDIFIRLCEFLQLDWQKVSEIQSPTESKEDSRKASQNTDQSLLNSPKKLKTEENINILVNQLRKQVKADIVNRCGTMRIFDMSQPIGLGKIYTQVNILEKISGRRRKKIASLFQNCNSEDFERFNLGKVTEEKIDGENAVKKYNRLIILGKPGAGKTTFLKYLAIQCNEDKFQGDLVPWFITLKDFAEADGQPKLLDYLGSYLKIEDRQHLEYLLDCKQALILLDGLDEVLEADSKRVIREIEILTNKYPYNQYVITCRIAAREYTFEKFTEVEIADFDWHQISNFARNWFRGKLFKPEKFLARLEEEEPIKELVSNPLLLTLLCVSFEELGDFPANRKELYEEGINALLRKWDSTRGIQRDRVYKTLSIAKKEDLLSEIAWKTFAPGDYFFKTDLAKRYISEYIRNLPGANLDDEALQGDSGVVLRNIEAQHGLLTARAKNIYSFSHLTFQEYFTAREIILVRHSTDEALQELVSHLFDKRWREVFLLAVSMSANAERLVLLMKEKIDNLLASDKDLQSCLKWLKRKTEKANLDLSPEDRETIEANYRFYTENKLTLARIFYLGLDLEFNLGLYLYRNLNLELYLYRNLNLELYQKLNLDLELYRNLDLDLDLELYRNPHLKLNLELAEKKAPQLYVALLELKRRLPDEKNTDFEKFVAWWKANGEAWSHDFRQAMIQHQDIGHDWQFSEEKKSLLEQYYFANQLLTQCLHHDCFVSPEVRQGIEATLLLPYEEIGY
ncbi:MAG: NACHT domain-containing NTPase [Cyanobacteria bacterium J06600_6]